MNPNSPATAKVIEAELSHQIIGAFFEVYNELGYGYLEAHYSKALDLVLRRRGLAVEREHEVIVMFQGARLGIHRLDMVVERRVVIELKSTERVPEGARRQLRNYLAATGIELGLLLHFGPAAKYYRILAPLTAERR